MASAQVSNSLAWSRRTVGLPGTQLSDGAGHPYPWHRRQLTAARQLKVAQRNDQLCWTMTSEACRS